MQHPISKQKWPNKYTVSTVMPLLLFIEIVWIFNYRTHHNVYKSDQDIWFDLGFMAFMAVFAIFAAYREHKIFIGDWRG